MKVGELIAMLSKYDPETEVLVTATDDPFVPLVWAETVDEVKEEHLPPGVDKAIGVFGSGG